MFLGQLRRFRPRGVLVLLGLFLPGVVAVGAYIGDVLAHAPPDAGSFAYNTFVPPNLPGASYLDPVFGSTVRRLTTDHATDDIYARNMWWNADGTRYFHKDAIVSTATGVVTHTGIPGGNHNFDRGFDPVDPNVLYYFSGSTVRKITLGSGGAVTDVAYYTVPSTLLSLGGTTNWLDASGRYMVLRYGQEPSVHVFDRQNLGAGPYAGPTDGSAVESGGYIGLTPDGKYVVGGGRSWAINHGTRSVGGTGTFFWGLCGDHAAFVSSSDGRDYAITANCYDYLEYWRVDITNNAQGLSATQVKALPNNRRLLGLPSWTFSNGHISAVAKGSLRDWAFVSTEDGSDVYNAPVSPWLPFRSEIIALNVVSGEIRRLAHHRSRSVDADYYNQPRVSSSWGGEFVGWSSNYDQSGVVDIFATPFSGGTLPPGVPSAPANLRIVR